ncbi:DUF6497 family protein [Marimonas lutisalis]|uniref:DUF6497 family protein n=1 Tax=Marimonas lutisalis TaxID=2545756 RepID=UPI001F381B82|nr:DUF6497 family protein [Marimonas lutisalis]
MLSRTLIARHTGRTPPAGGASMSCWGRWACALALAAAGAAAGAGGAGAADRAPVPPLPSGLEARLQEVVLDVKPDGQLDYARYRFVADALVAEPDFDLLLSDLEFLCNSYALPDLTASVARYDRIVISLADRETELGVASPDATQFFELYRVENGACIWEAF